MSDDHDSHAATYFTVFLALCALTAVSVVSDLLHLADHRVLVAIVMAVSTAKALCVMLFFMHLKFERAWKYLLLGPTMVLAISLPLALAPDIGMHYYLQDVPQTQEYERQQAEGAPPAAEHHP
ncbi:cytochrome C oxidase subunit IV family protein [Planctellipticum variicoloris]|uniref:cytochrome C oxidase subunit IV family protein n=1 Tax=Planctellipticum variicoloris TaxID=3064265 RepID=UPI0030133AED|nr:cytochrome C oxidase subunit IV family protein [Planctomycetaceae bacterium SH412]